MFKELAFFIHDLYQKKGLIGLHEPIFSGNEKKYLNECIDSTFVSSVGKFVAQFEELIADFTGAKYAVATMNGTSALHIALLLLGVEQGSEVITQPLTFVATCNAISYCNAKPVFVDVDKETLGLSPASLSNFLENNSEIKNNICFNKNTGKKISAVVPMHTFGHPAKMDEIVKICDEWKIPLLEDAAESIGSSYRGQQTGTFGKIGVLSFNGNKTITTGGGGMIISDDEVLSKRAKHITTTGKIPHKWEYIHDETAFNYRMPNINAALGVAQIEKLPEILNEKRKIALSYKNFCDSNNINFIEEPPNSISNYWLNGIITKNFTERNRVLKILTDNKIMARPIWKLMNELTMYKNCQYSELSTSKWLSERVVNLPSGVRTLK